MQQKNKLIVLNIDRSWSFGREFMTGFIHYSRLYTDWDLDENRPFYIKKSTSFTENVKKADCVIAPAKEINKLNPEILNQKHIIVFPTTQNLFQNAINILTDNDNIGKMAAEFFIHKGFKQYAFFGYPSMDWAIERGNSFADFLNQAGFDIRMFAPKRKSSPVNAESSLVSNWLLSLQKPVAVFCCNDERAQDLIDVARKLNLRIPYDVAVLGVDNDEYLCNVTVPSISSIRLNIEDTGYKTAELLDLAFKTDDFSSQTVFVDPSRIINRESADTYAIFDESALKALDYIKSNSRNLIQASDVAEYVGLSRRHLDKKFMDLLGYTVSAQIKKTKINLICEMLSETRENISLIAQKIGFLETDHFSRFFYSQTGLTPTQYRNKNQR